MNGISKEEFQTNENFITILLKMISTLAIKLSQIGQTHAELLF